MFALGYNTLMIPTAAGVFYPLTHMQVRGGCLGHFLCFLVVKLQGTQGCKRCRPAVCVRVHLVQFQGLQRVSSACSIFTLDLAPAVATLGGGRLHGAVVCLSRVLLPPSAAVPPATPGTAGHAHYPAMTTAQQAQVVACVQLCAGTSALGHYTLFPLRIPLFLSASLFLPTFGFPTDSPGPPLAGVHTLISLPASVCPPSALLPCA